MKVDNVVKRSKFANASHNHKAIRHILEKYPRDEIPQMDDALLYEHAISILRLQERPQVALYTRPDLFGRYISCLVYVPREKYETRLRLKFQHILEEKLGGKCTNYKVSQDDSPLSRVLYQIDINTLNKIPKFNRSELEISLIKASQNWSDRLRETIEDKIEDTDRAAQLIQRYGHAFPVSYHEHYAPAQAVLDIEKISKIIDGDQINLELYQQKDGNELQTCLKLYHAKTPLELSDVLPIMENMGLDVVTEFPSAIQPARFQHNVWIHDFLVRPSHKNKNVDINAAKSSF